MNEIMAVELLMVLGSAMFLLGGLMLILLVLFKGMRL